MRIVLTRLTALAGVMLAVTSFALALPVRLPGAATAFGGWPMVTRPIPYLPAVFILGIMLIFLAAVVYELLPDRAEGPTWSSGPRRRGWP
jgi:hypothetical protein